MHRHDTNTLNCDKHVQRYAAALCNIVICTVARRCERYKGTTGREHAKMYMLNTFKNPAPIPTPTNETRKKNEQTDSLNNSVGTVIVSGMSISFSFLHAKAIVL